MLCVMVESQKPRRKNTLIRANDRKSVERIVNGMGETKYTVKGLLLWSNSIHESNLGSNVGTDQ